MQRTTQKLWSFFDAPLLRTDWTSTGWGQQLYIGFNAMEALIWFCVAVFIWVRWAKNRQSAIEHLYAISFVVFGLTDLLEMDHYTASLLLLKGFVLATILLCRHLVLKHYAGRRI